MLGLNQSATTRVVVRKRKKSVVVVESGPDHKRNHLSVYQCTFSHLGLCWPAELDTQ